MYPYIRYLPDYLQEVKEYQELGRAADPLAEAAYAFVRQQYANQLILTADEPTLARWEGILRLPYQPLYDLDTRRQRILLRFQGRMRITVKKLREILEAITGADCRVIVDGPAYSMEISIYERDYTKINLPLIAAEVYRLKPANILGQIHVVAETEISLTLFMALDISTERRYEWEPTMPARPRELEIPLLIGIDYNKNTSTEMEVTKWPT